jgi:hypothetical protein
VLAGLSSLLIAGLAITDSTAATTTPPDEASASSTPSNCFDVRSAGLSAQADPASPFDGVGVVSMGGDDVVVIQTSVVPTNDLSAGYIDATRHTITFPSDPGRPWDGVVVLTEDVVERVPLTPGIHPLVGVMTAVEGATGEIRTLEGTAIDLTDPAGGLGQWIVEGQLCFA